MVSPYTLIGVMLEFLSVMLILIPYTQVSCIVLVVIITVAGAVGHLLPVAKRSNLRKWNQRSVALGHLSRVITCLLDLFVDRNEPCDVLRPSGLDGLILYLGK